jgi:peptide deformylase
LRRKIVTVLTNPALLRKKSSRFPDLDNFSDSDKSALQDLSDTFDVLQGYGLALPQIGICKRAIAINFAALGQSDLGSMTIMINPELTCSGEMVRQEESCFSVPHISCKVSRSSSVTVKYTSLLGVSKQLDLTGIAAACLQHEVDHLDGKVYIDKIGSAWRSILLKKIKKIEKRMQANEIALKKDFEAEHRELMGLSDTKKKTTYSKKRKRKVRKKRVKKSKKK